MFPFGGFLWAPDEDATRAVKRGECQFQRQMLCMDTRSSVACAKRSVRATLCGHLGHNVVLEARSQTKTSVIRGKRCLKDVQSFGPKSGLTQANRGNHGDCQSTELVSRLDQALACGRHHAHLSIYILRT